MTVSLQQSTVKRQVEIIFYVTNGTNSPYQGRLLYDAAVYDGMAQADVIADGLAQFNAWLAAQTLSADQLTTQEVAANLDQVMTLGSLAAISLSNSTAAQNIAALRVVYQTSTQFQAVMIGDFLNTLTNAQLMAAFSMTLVQVQSLRTNKLAPAASVAASIRASAGQ